MYKPNIYIRTDGSSEIGLGHIVRCIALAQMLEKFFNVTFFCIEITESLTNEIIKNGWSLKKINSEDDFFSNISSFQIVILDGYSFNLNYQIRIKSKKVPLICIEDYKNVEILADIIINHAPGITENDYKVEKHTKLLLGTPYSILRKEFLEKEQLNYSLDKKKSIVVCFGGSDYKNLTTCIIKWIPKEKHEIIVITGSSFTHTKELDFEIAQRNGLKITHLNSLSSSQMHNYLQSAYIKIVPSSGVLFEAISMRGIIISGYYTQNQLEVYKGFKRLKVIIDAEDFNKQAFIRAYNIAINCDSNKIIQRQKECIDGLSNKRIQKEILQLSFRNFIACRRAKISDAKQYYKWANNLEVRKNSFNSEIIEWNNHLVWFSNKISSEDSILLIYRYNNSNVGQVRFERIKNNSWLINYAIDEDYRGLGLGSFLIQSALKNIEKKKRNLVILAYVKPDNTASIKIFRKLRFLEKDNNKELLFIYETNI